MTKVSFYRDANGLFKGFESFGHSGYSVKGEYVVCAGISALTINAVNSLDAFTDAKLFVEADEKEAFLGCRLGKGYEGEDVQLIFRSLELGIRGIEDQNKDFIRISYEEV